MTQPSAQPSVADRTRHSRARRASRPSGDEREQAILATAERLLADRPLGEISIDELARGAGISRPTFYFYFESKDAVLLTLLERVVAEADRAAFDVPPQRADDRAAAWRDAINVFFTTFRAHRAVAVASAQARATNVEVRQLWTKVMEHWVQRTEEAIQAERDRGAAPAGIPARELAISLNLMNERVMYATFAAEEPSVPEPHVVDTLLHVWLTSIYQPVSG
ncbi:TetR/AcrR family transcriptional regulator [Pseudonocardia acaciae]|uniref:TetR/AcrR family transcriptional regulator n=1 Tax=Pseudonocardia acaciae TaxID=551276 RepID=UPI00048D0345|nr:TetR/AcrR family transcriptional regulator [Pseudonocardia acaciae]